MGGFRVESAGRLRRPERLEIPSSWGFTVRSDEIQLRSQRDPVSRAEESMACPNPLPNLTTAEVTKDAVLSVVHERPMDCPLSVAIDRVSSELRISRASVKAAIAALDAGGEFRLTAPWGCH